MADFTIVDVHNLAPAMGVVSTDLLAVGQSDTNLHKLNLGELSNYLGTSGGLLEFNDLDGFLYDVQYNSTNHRLTFYQQNEPNIVIDLPIEQLIKGVQLVGNDLIFTFEDGSTVTVPLNTLLVGVVKSVNGLTPNSQGEIILNVNDIPNLSSELANKLDVRMAGLVSNLTQLEKDAILGKLGVVNNIVQVLGLSGNTITLSNGGGSISLNIANIGGLQTALDLKANVIDVYSKAETQTVVNSAIVNLGNVVNSVNGVNVDNSDPKNPIIAEFRPIADYNNDMLNKADIDGNLTTGGIWWQDQVLSDRFANYKQVWTALTNNTIEWGNIELDKHIFLVDDADGLKIKVGGSEGTVWNELNLDPTEFELVANKQNNLNADGTGQKYPTVDAVSTLKPIYHHFSGQTTVTITHNRGMYASVGVMLGTEMVFSNIDQDVSMNSVTVNFSIPQTGIIILNF